MILLGKTDMLVLQQINKLKTTVIQITSYYRIPSRALSPVRPLMFLGNVVSRLSNQMSVKLSTVDDAPASSMLPLEQ